MKEVEGAILAWHKDNESQPTTCHHSRHWADHRVGDRGDCHRSHAVPLGPAVRGLDRARAQAEQQRGKERQGGISKQGDHYLRRLLVLGATAVIRHARTKVTAETDWLQGVLDRRPVRLASVAQANKTARIV